MAIFRKKTVDGVHADFVDILESTFQSYDDGILKKTLTCYLIRHGLVHAVYRNASSQTLLILTNPKYITSRIQTHFTSDIHEFLFELSYWKIVLKNSFIDYFYQWFSTNIHLMNRATKDWSMLQIFAQKIYEDNYLKPYFANFGVGSHVVEQDGITTPFVQKQLLDRFVDLEKSSVYVHGRYVLAWRPGKFGCTLGHTEMWRMTNSIRTVYVDAQDKVYAQTDYNNPILLVLDIDTDRHMEVLPNTRLIGGMLGSVVLMKGKTISWNDVSFVLPDAEKEESITISEDGYIFYIYQNNGLFLTVIDIHNHVVCAPYKIENRYDVGEVGLIEFDEKEIHFFCLPQHKTSWQISELLSQGEVSDIHSVKSGFIITLTSQNHKKSCHYLIQNKQIYNLPLGEEDNLKVHSFSVPAWMNPKTSILHIWTKVQVVETQPLSFHCFGVQKSKFHDGWIAVGRRRLALIDEEGKIQTSIVLGDPIPNIRTKVEELSLEEFVWWDAREVDPWQVVMFRMNNELTDYYLASRSVNVVLWKDGISEEKYSQYETQKKQHQESLRTYKDCMYKVHLVLEGNAIHAYSHTVGEPKQKTSLVWTIQSEDEEDLSMYILDGNYILVSDDSGCSLHWQDGTSVHEVFWTDNICTIDFGLILYGERLVFVTEDFGDMESRSLLLNEHGDNDAFADTLYELEKWYPELSPIRQGVHSNNNESRGGVLGMYGLNGTLYIERFDQFPLLETEVQSEKLAQWETEWLAVPYRVLDEKHFLITIGEEYKMLQIQYVPKGWSK